MIKTLPFPRPFKAEHRENIRRSFGAGPSLYEYKSILRPYQYRSELRDILLALVVPDVGEVRLGSAALGQSAMTATVKLKLYTNNVTPAEGDVRTTYTEASGNGYAEASITNANWNTTTSSGTTTSAYPEIAFTFTGAEGDNYGYLVCDATAGTLLWSERFPTAPYNIANNGDQIKITLQIQWA